jgi:hypothetical protein
MSSNAQMNSSGLGQNELGQNEFVPNELGPTTLRQEFAPFRQNLLRDSATQGTEKAPNKLRKAGHR